MMKTKTTLTLLILLNLISLNVFAQNLEYTSFNGHTDDVHIAVFSPDSKTIATGSYYDETVRLWDVATGENTHTFTGYWGDVTTLAFSPDFKTIATIDVDTVLLWDIETGENTHTLTQGRWDNYTHWGGVNSVAFSPDGKIIATGGNDSDVRLWDVETGEYTHLLEGHTNDVNSVAFSPDSKTIATGSDDDTVRLWNVETGENMHTFKGHTDYVNSVAFSPDSKTIATGSDDNTVRLWNFKTGEYTHILAEHECEFIAFSPDGKTIATGGDDHIVRLWNVPTTRITHTLIEQEGGIATQLIAFSPDSKTIATEILGGMFLWDVETETKKTFGYGVLTGNMAFSPDLNTIATWDLYQTLRLWDADTGENTHTFYNPNYNPNSNYARNLRVDCVAFSPDSKTIATGSSDELLLWDIETGENTHILTEHDSRVECIAFSPDGKTIAAGSQGLRYPKIWLWDIATGEITHTLEGHTDDINSVAFSPDGKTIASQSIKDLTLRLWDVATGENTHTFTGSRDSRFGIYITVYSGVFSPDGKTFATYEIPGFQEVDLWDVATGENTHTLEGHTDDVNSVAFSPDSKTIATGSDDHTVRLWDAATGENTYILAKVQGPVSSVAFSPDGKTIASGHVLLESEDFSVAVILWDITPYVPDAALDPEQPIVPDIGLAPEKPVATDVNGDGFVNLLDVQVVDSRMGMTGKDTADDKGDADVNGDGIVNITDLALVTKIIGDVNGDSVVNLKDLDLIGKRLWETGKNTADINADGIVNIADLVLVAGNALSHTAAAAPSTYKHAAALLTVKQVQQWLNQARLLGETAPIYQRGIFALEQLLTMLTPKQTSLLPNYPNPFNPETWIPYQLAHPADVKISIYAVDGTLVRTLDLGYQPVGMYKNRSRAAHWDGRNALGESVASGIYLYEFTAGDFSTTRKMLIRK